MAKTFYKYVGGKRVAMTNREVKAYIMKQNGWNSTQYKKQYDIFKNKLRAYENYERASGKEVTSQSPVEVLFKEAKAKARDGVNYTPSIKMKRIRSFTSVSSGKAGQKALQGSLYRQRRAITYEDATYKQFKGLIESNNKAKAIYDIIKDPVMREKALSDYANKLHAKINEQDEVLESEAIPFGETYGSDEQIDFDIENYL